MKHLPLRCAVLLAFMALLALSIPGLTQAATITVNSNEDLELPADNGNCTLREAISAANLNISVDECEAGVGADTIKFDSDLNGILLQAGDLQSIEESLTISGPGSDKFVIDGDDQYRIFQFNSPNDDQIFLVSGLKITQGSAPNGGAIQINLGETVTLRGIEFEANTANNNAGGAVHVLNTSTGRTTVKIERCTFIGNRAMGPSGGGALQISSGTDTSVSDSSFISNVSSGGPGGAIFATSTSILADPSILTIERTTFFQNRTNRYGGALALSGNQQATMVDSTIFNNTANQDFIVEDLLDHGGGIAVIEDASIVLKNTVLNANRDLSQFFVVDDIFVGFSNATFPVTSLGHNFLSTNGSVEMFFSAGVPNDNFDYVGTPLNPLDAELDALGDSSGPTKTYAPLPDSIVIDRGSCEGALNDQRGFGNLDTRKRVVDIDSIANGANSDGCDIGAFESQAVFLPPLVNDEICVPITTQNNKVALVCL